MSFLDRCCSCHHRLRALGFDYCAIALCIIRKAGLRREIALINSAESQGFGFLFVSVPETDQHKKQKSGERKGGQANQNATNHRASSRYPSPHQSRFEKSAREKDSSALFDICHWPTAHAYPSSQPCCCSAASTARAKRGYNCGLLGAASRRWSVVASHYPRFRCGGSDHRRLLAGRYSRP